MTSRLNGSRRISLLLGIAILLVGAPALAKKRVVITKFEGKGEYAQRAATAAIAKDSTVVSDGAWRRALRHLHSKTAGKTPEGIARAAAEVQADAIVQGAVTGHHGGIYTLTMTIIDGKSGQVSDS